jgi:hypothetical protein
MSEAHGILMPGSPMIGPAMPQDINHVLKPFFGLWNRLVVENEEPGYTAHRCRSLHIKILQNLGVSLQHAIEVI